MGQRVRCGKKTLKIVGLGDTASCESSFAEETITVFLTALGL